MNIREQEVQVEKGTYGGVLRRAAIQLILVPLMAVASYGDTIMPSTQERELQATVFLGQPRQAVERYLNEKRIEYSHDKTEGRLYFSVKNIGSDGIVAAGIGGTINFDSRDRVMSYEIRWHLTGP